MNQKTYYAMNIAIMYFKIYQEYQLTKLTYIHCIKLFRQA